MTAHTPKPLGDPISHYWLAVSMAKAAGVDLVAAMDEGKLTQQDWAGMVQRCRGCDWERDGGCSRWLSFQEDGGAVVPGSCVNQATFRELTLPE
ncbi:MAG: hypothetical protein KDA50_02185 [Rhodobacteraceae bacterium]|nr:hypothetical protein [Paracoccaceae bacterium]